MGSEMCIRDRVKVEPGVVYEKLNEILKRESLFFPPSPGGSSDVCLLYTSDAADERSSVDLGGRRIIKKKKLHIIRDVTSQKEKV